jgi:hypothetical protein
MIYMKRRFIPILLTLLSTYLAVQAQDEGTIAKKERVTRGKSVYFFAGPSFRFGNNDGDYSGGLQLEAGYLARLNRIVSVGPSLSFSKFKYDESISDSYGNKDATGNNIFMNAYEIFIVELQGGDLTHFSAGLDVKIDFIPMTDSRRFNVYGLVKPFLLLSNRKEVSATVEYWQQNNLGDPPSEWYYSGPTESVNSGTTGYSQWGAKTEFSGGVNLGIGAEYSLPSGISFSVQSSLRMTLPVTYVNTSAFNPTIQSGYLPPEYPLVKDGFTTLNISLGAVYRF